MRDITNWDDIQESEGFENPTPGAYIARIVSVADMTEKEYLRIEWDFDEGQFKGANQDTFSRAGFWPTALIRSYKEKALGFFKAFKTAVEESNPGYVFSTSDPCGLVGKRVGVILGQEGYTKSSGEHGKRLYVAQTRSVSAIQRGDFTVPEYREARARGASAPSPAWAPGTGAGTSDWSFHQTDDDGDLPF